jgi:ABC-type antimicrobial peptide transport system permease subunit
MILHTRGRTARGAVVAVDALVASARAQVVRLDPELPILSARPLAEAIRGAFIFLDLTATMLFIFGAAGMALAAMGTYGLVSYTVAQSTHEIGIRMTLGASRSTVVRAFLARGFRLGVIGAAIGLVAAFGGARLLDSVLFGVSATDTTAFLRAVVVVLAGVLLATFVPAWRASRTDPLHALRHR